MEIKRKFVNHPSNANPCRSLFESTFPFFSFSSFTWFDRFVEKRNAWINCTSEEIARKNVGRRSYFQREEKQVEQFRLWRVPRSNGERVSVLFNLALDKSAGILSAASFTSSPLFYFSPLDCPPLLLQPCNLVLPLFQPPNSSPPSPGKGTSDLSLLRFSIVRMVG